MNECLFLGTLCKEVELQERNGKSFLQNSIAVQRIGNGADFVPIVAFGKTAEVIAKYFTKGSKIAVTSQFQSGSYEKDGKKVYTQNFVVNKVDFCEKKGADSSNDGFSSADGDDLPFC